MVRTSAYTAVSTCFYMRHYGIWTELGLTELYLVSLGTRGMLAQCCEHVSCGCPGTIWKLAIFYGHSFKVSNRRMCLLQALELSRCGEAFLRSCFLDVSKYSYSFPQPPALSILFVFAFPFTALFSLMEVRVEAGIILYVCGVTLQATQLCEPSAGEFLASLVVRLPSLGSMRLAPADSIVAGRLLALVAVRLLSNTRAVIQASVGNMLYASVGSLL